MKELHVIFLTVTLLLCGPVYGQFAEVDLHDLDAKLRTPKLEVSAEARTALRRIADAGGPSGEKAEDLLRQFEEDAVEWATAAGARRQSLLPSANYISLRFNKRVSPQSFAYLYRNPNISILDIQGVSITDEHAAAVSNFRKLGLLSLVSTSVTGECFSSLELPNLKILNLIDSPVTDEAISKANFPSLVKLDLRGTRITGDSLRTIRMTGLRELGISNTEVTAADLRHLKRFTSLVVLTLDSDALDVTGVKDVLAIPSLERMIIYDTGEDPAHIKQLKEKLGDRFHLTVHPPPK